MNKLVLACEHASQQLPKGIDLGVGPDVLDSHVAWDPGALEVALVVHRQLHVPLLAGEYTRLFVDLNRSEDHPDVIPESLFGTPIPGNLGLTQEQRRDRIRRFHRPFRSDLRNTSTQYIAAGHRSVHLAIHSFTPVLGDQVRSYEVGVMYNPDRWLDVTVGELFLEQFDSTGFEVRCNEPYHGVGPGNTTWLRNCFGQYDFAGITIELSHRLIAQKERVAQASRTLCDIAQLIRDTDIG